MATASLSQLGPPFSGIPRSFEPLAALCVHENDSVRPQVIHDDGFVVVHPRMVPAWGNPAAVCGPRIRFGGAMNKFQGADVMI